MTHKTETSFLQTGNSDNIGLKKILSGSRHFRNPRLPNQKTVTLSSSLKKTTKKEKNRDREKTIKSYGNYVDYLPPGIDSENLDYVYD